MASSIAEAMIKAGITESRIPFNVNLRPVCVHCSCEMECRRNGVHIHLSKSDAYLSGDTYTCPTCKNSIVKGFAKKATFYNTEPKDVVAKIEL